MSEKHLVDGIYYTEDGLGITCKEKYGNLTIVTRNKIGQGWGFDLRNITPNGLRVLADFLEKYEQDLKSK